jgi:glycosyltransferase involved in cell wall biosynthesis
MRISVAVITYNWPAALEQVLRALAAQSELPYEVIVTDDGSQPATRELVARIAQSYPVRLVYLWQTDDGARMSRARNRAIAAAQGDYLILLDGDMVTERHFVADHHAYARRGCFVQGSRVLTDAPLTRRMLEQNARAPGLFSRGIERRRHTLRLPALARWYARPGTKQRGIKSCNMAFWRDDLLRLNGFNEAMTGWGREDTELAVRAFHAGLLRRELRFSALATHLYHPTRKHPGTRADPL